MILMLVFFTGVISATAQDVSFIVLGDMHYDQFRHHDMEYVKTRPQDYEQITKEYPKYTDSYLPSFLQLIKKQTTVIPNVKAVVQLGDLVEGVAGNLELARQMNHGAVSLLQSAQLQVPWVLVKGNHDVSNSPGQPQAWEEVIEPFMQEQLKKPVNHGMYTYMINQDIEFFIADQFFSVDRNLPESAMIDFLEKELSVSKARFKFFMAHQPVVPVTQRCWHLFAGIRRPLSDSSLRNRFLNLLAKYHVFVLSAHLHEYSVLSRETLTGNIVQVMVNSVNRGVEPAMPKSLTTEYKGEGWVIEKPDWQPSTKEVRLKLLAEEKKHILDFKRADLPGYAVITVRPKRGDVVLTYYNGISDKPFENINLTSLQNLKTN